MTTTTVSRLLSWEPHQLGDVGAELARVADTWRTAVDEAGSLNADLDLASFRGQAADAVRENGDAIVGALGSAAESIDFAAQSLLRAAASLAMARDLLEQGRSLAEAHSLRVLEDGRVPPPPPSVTPADLPALEMERIAAERRNAADAARAAQAMATEALAAADDVDRQTAAALELARFSPRLPERSGRGLVGILARILPDGALAFFRAAYLAALGVRDIPPPGSDPFEVAAWWNSLIPDARELIVDRFPELIGNLDGVPFAVRDQANRAVLASTIAQVEAEMAALVDSPEHFSWPHPDGAMHAVGRYLQLEEQLVMLRAVESSLGSAAAVPPRSLLILDPRLPGRAAVALGDLDTASNISVMVPGMGTTVSGSLDRYMDAAKRLHDTQTEWSRVLGMTPSVATVAWLGYEAPGLTAVPFYGSAEIGAEYLRGTLTGIHARTTTEGADRQLTLVGHSYGSLVAGLAVTERTGVDSVVFVGSPGVGAGHVTELSVPVGEVFVGEAARDDVADFGRFGVDPSDPDFGARIMSVAGGIDPVTGAEMARSTGHSGYYDADSESLRNIALVGLGRGDLVTEGGPGGSATGAVKRGIRWLLPGW